MFNEIKLFKPGFLTPAMATNSEWEMPNEVRLTPLGSGTSVAASPLWSDDALANLHQQQQQQHLLEEAQQQLQAVEQEQKAQEQLEAQRQHASMKWKQQLQEREKEMLLPQSFKPAPLICACAALR